MKRLALALIVALAAAPAFAGKFEKDVKDLGSADLRPGAIDKLADAGLDAFDDLMEGLKADPAAADISMTERGERSTRRMACAQLLGMLRDTRASAEMVKILKDEKTRQEYPDFCATLVQSLGKIWGGKAVSGERTETVAEIKRLAADETAGPKLRYGSLLALAHLKDGADIAVPLLADDVDEVLRNAAVGVITATGHKASSARLAEIWTKQREGESKNFNRSLGLSCLFALAEFKDMAALDGLIDVLTMMEFDRDEATRARARGYLKQFTADATPKLAAIIQDDDKTIKHARAAELLGILGGAGVKALLEIAKLDKEGERKFTDRVDGLLRALRGDEANAALIEAFRGFDPKDPMRVKVLDQLLLSRPRQAVAVFKEASTDKNLEAPARARAVDAYAESEGKESLELLKALMVEEDLVVRRAAVRNIGRSFIPQAKSEALLVAALKDADGEVRSLALRGLQLARKKELLKDFLDRMNPELETDASVRRAAIESLEAFNRNAGLNFQGLLDPLKKALDDKDANVRAAAVRVGASVAEGSGQPSAGKEILEKAYADAEGVVRSQAYTMTYRFSDRVEASKLVEAALKETQMQQKGDAVQALIQLPDLGDGDLGGLRELALSVLVQQSSRTNAGHARTLVGKLTAKGVRAMAPDVRDLLSKAWSAQPRNNAQVVILIETLSDLKDLESFVRVKEMAREPNVEVRQACVRFISANGERSDIAFLQELRDLNDAAGPAVRADIENAIRELEGR